jgi:hypothetical protein
LCNGSTTKHLARNVHSFPNYEHLWQLSTITCLPPKTQASTAFHEESLAFKLKEKCSGGNLQALHENGREASLEISGTKAVNCSGGNLQALRENGREGSLEISGMKAVNCNGGNLQARRGFCLGKKMQNCHPGAQRPVLPRKKNAKLSCHKQTDRQAN